MYIIAAACVCFICPCCYASEFLYLPEPVPDKVAPLVFVFIMRCQVFSAPACGNHNLNVMLGQKRTQPVCIIGFVG